jgi:hypothetical protein
MAAKNSLCPQGAILQLESLIWIFLGVADAVPALRTMQWNFALATASCTCQGATGE